MFSLEGRFFAGAISSALLLSACAGGATPTIPSRSVDLANLSRSQPDVLAFGKWMYLAQFYGEDAGVYKRVKRTKLKYYETLTKGIYAPQGTVATVNGWWYLANGVNVLVYRSTSKGPIADVPLNDPGQFAVNVDVTSSRQLAAVSNGSSTSSGAGSVSVYLGRQPNPSRTLTYGSDPVQGTGVAIDRQGNCYWGFNDPTSNSGSIVEFAGCQGSGTPLISGIANAQGLVFDQHGNLYYIDQPVGIYKCRKATSNCKLFVKGFSLPTNLNFDQKDKQLWVADAAGYVYAVNAKGKIVSTMQIGGPTNPPFGIAPAPG